MRFFTPLVAALATLIGLKIMPVAAQGDEIFETNDNGALLPAGHGTIGEYTTSGTTVNASLITGLNNPHGIAASGSNLFVVNTGAFNAGDTYISNTGSIGEYTTSGTVVNASLITGLNEPAAIAVSGSNLFVAITLADHALALTF